MGLGAFGIEEFGGRDAKGEPFLCGGGLEGCAGEEFAGAFFFERLGAKVGRLGDIRTYSLSSSWIAFADATT